jgi:hypothetical protein
MKKQLIIIGIVALIVCVGLSGCDEVTNPLKSDKDKLVGTWTVTQGGVTAIMNFFYDGTFSGKVMGVTNSGGTYEFKDGKLVLTSNSAEMLTYDYSFSSDGKELTIRKLGDNKDYIYTKQ